MVVTSLRITAGTAATEDSPRSPERGPAVSTTCNPPSFEIADVVAILPKWRATAPDGVPNEAFQSAPQVVVTHLENLLQKVFMDIPARGVAPGWLTFRRPRKQDWEAINPNADRWGWRPALPTDFRGS